MIRFGVDFGGTKIEVAALDRSGQFVARVRKPNPGSYEAALEVVADLLADAECMAGSSAARLGLGIPGSISPRTGLIRNANSVYLNGRTFAQDLEARLARPVRLANDANCLALSEAADGAGAGQAVVFAAILGTGCGGGLVVDGRIIEGRNGIAGEWGHMPLPWPRPDDEPAPACWCGRKGCLETWIAGPAFARDAGHPTGQSVMAAIETGDAGAISALDRLIDRTGRALALICDMVDPDVIVLGGGLSNIAALYDRLPAAIAPHVFSDTFETPVRKAAHGDSSGVRGAVWLWPLDDA
ncbi:ROK family protein [Caulobacter henricii]|uniref:Transcriptional regulator n=1 Tax=Caulobacter henricii TaxID=69395 RepID=A0A0P0NZZ4_9CAUL|nr:ROK family protein [Caulobacter henricii]ALL13717.1 transcriptional regulator [Caulobacter henricii]